MAVFKKATTIAPTAQVIETKKEFSSSHNPLCRGDMYKGKACGWK